MKTAFEFLSEKMPLFSFNKKLNRIYFTLFNPSLPEFFAIYEDIFSVYIFFQKERISSIKKANGLSNEDVAEKIREIILEEIEKRMSEASRRYEAIIFANENQNKESITSISFIEAISRNNFNNFSELNRFVKSIGDSAGNYDVSIAIFEKIKTNNYFLIKFIQMKEINKDVRLVAFNSCAEQNLDILYPAIKSLELENFNASKFNIYIGKKRTIYKNITKLGSLYVTPDWNDADLKRYFPKAEEIKEIIFSIGPGRGFGVYFYKNLKFINSIKVSKITVNTNNQKIFFNGSTIDSNLELLKKNYNGELKIN